MEIMGIKTFTVDGDERNIKITTPADLSFAKIIYEEMGEW